jgi:serine/threonine-protein kinase
MLEKGRALTGDTSTVLGALGQAHALSGNHAEARALLGRLADLSKKQYQGSTSFALIHLGLGEIDQALGYLEKACDCRELPVTVLKVHPAYDALRGEARFAALLKRIGFAD